MIPKPPNEYDESDEYSSTSNNILSPTFTATSLDNVVVKPTEAHGTNNGETAETNALPNTQPDSEGNCNQAKYVLIAMTSVILSFLCN